MDDDIAYYEAILEDLDPDELSRIAAEAALLGDGYIEPEAVEPPDWEPPDMVQPDPEPEEYEPYEDDLEQDGLNWAEDW